MTAIAGAPDTLLPAWGWGHHTAARCVADGRLLTKRGGPFTVEDAARLREFLCPLGKILDACCRLAHLGQA